jgi:hypothetical protein
VCPLHRLLEDTTASFTPVSCHPGAAPRIKKGINWLRNMSSYRIYYGRSRTRFTPPRDRRVLPRASPVACSQFRLVRASLSKFGREEGASDSDSSFLLLPYSIASAPNQKQPPGAVSAHEGRACFSHEQAVPGQARTSRKSASNFRSPPYCRRGGCLHGDQLAAADVLLEHEP